MSQTIPVSIELFPPQTDTGRDKLIALCQGFSSFAPRYFSVTHGASGSAQDHTIITVEHLLSHGVETVPHLSCVGLTVERAHLLLKTYLVLGVKQLVVIRGDAPTDNHNDCFHTFRYACELIQFIEQHYAGRFKIVIAAYPEFHPEATNAFQDIVYFKEKIQAGATAAITQYFFDANAYYHFINVCAQYQIDIPIIPGIMPINDYDKLLRISKLCQTEVPLWIHRRMQSYRDKQSQLSFSIEIIVKLCEDLMGFGAPGLHLYALNQSEPVTSILTQLGFDYKLSKKTGRKRVVVDESTDC